MALLPERRMFEKPSKDSLSRDGPCSSHQRTRGRPQQRGAAPPAHWLRCGAAPIPAAPPAPRSALQAAPPRVGNHPISFCPTRQAVGRWRGPALQVGSAAGRNRGKYTRRTQMCPAGRRTWMRRATTGRDVQRRAQAAQRLGAHPQMRCAHRHRVQLAPGTGNARTAMKRVSSVRVLGF